MAMLAVFAAAALLLGGGQVRAQSAPPVAGDQCPDDFMAFKDENDPLACTCPAEATRNGAVWGTDVYTGDSAICRAALHAGRVGRNGGPVIVQGEQGRRAYPGTTRNGVSSNNFGPYESSYRFVGETAAAPPPPATAPSATFGTIPMTPLPPAAAPGAAPGAAQVQCPDNYAAFKDETAPFACICPAELTRSGSVWGTDTYTADSSVCRAALHAGQVGRNGGPVTIIGEPGRPFYPGTTRNGISSSNYREYDWSFRFEGGPPPGPAQCPDNFAAYKDEVGPLACVCPADQVRNGSVWGTDVYTADSAICRAALHAGRVPRNGGPVTVVGEPGRRAYPGTTRNGISSSNYPEYEWSFRFEGPAITASAAPSGPATSSICPDNAVAYKDDPTPIACLCPAEATDRGSVWGTDIYTTDSGLCRAALHAGMITRLGGPVTFVTEPGRRAYPGSTRNGVASSNYREYDSSFRFTGLPARTAVPVQASIADSLRAAGRVNLYVQFRTNSADLDIASAPVLAELLAALRADPSIRLRLVGHTDTQGTRAINGPLSIRRAGAVREWLIAQGIETARLIADGRGQDEPIAPNTTEDGRALNRRVAASLIP